MLKNENKGCNKKSGLHELDIIAVREGVTGFPTNEDLALGIECKAYMDDEPNMTCYFMK